MKTEREIKETIPFTIAMKRIKYLGINLPKNTKELYIENYKTLMKEIKEDTNRWRNIPCSWIGRINIVKLSILPKAIYCNSKAIQCNPYQATNSIFQRTRTNNFTICMEIQKTSNRQSNLEKEEWNWRNQPAWLQALLQSYSVKTVWYWHKDRNIDQWNKIESPEINPHTLSLTKEARIYNGEKTISLTSGAGKTGQPLVNEWN